MNQDYTELLLNIYKGSRLYPHWKDVFLCHPEEDQAYFSELDRMSGLNLEDCGCEGVQ